MRPFLICLSLLVFASSAHAARLEISDGDPVEIYISVDTPTVVTFPEKIKAIPTSADPQALSLEIEGERLFIQSLREGFEAVLFVVGRSGRLHLLRLVEHEPPDAEVQLIPPPAPPRFEDTPPAAAGRPRQPQGKPLRRLMVAMLRGDTLFGVEVLAHEQPLVSSKDIEIRTTHLYAAGRYLGFVGTARNLTGEPYVLRLPEYQAPGLKAIAADLEAIPAGGVTRVYLVVEPGSPY